jgi:hypothetical protein
MKGSCWRSNRVRGVLQEGILEDESQSTSPGGVLE